jgi:Tfp pilus assembly protein FimT
MSPLAWVLTVVAVLILIATPFMRERLRRRR